MQADADMKQRLQLLRLLYSNSCPDFIEDLVYIEDKENADDPIVKFKLWENQKAGLETLLTSRRVIALKARQLGFTWLALAYSVWRMVFMPGQDIFALSRTEDPDAYNLISRVVFILERLPPWLIERGKTKSRNLTWSATTGKVVIRHPDGVDGHGRAVIRKDSVFQSFAATQDAARSWTGDVLILDEMAAMEYARELWKAALPTINRPTSGQVVCISTNRLNSFYEETYRKAMIGANNFTRVFWPWNTDPRRDAAWYERTKRDLPDADDMAREYPATEEEAFARHSGSFFAELRREIHVVPPGPSIPAYYRRYAALDYGLDGYAALWFHVDRAGRSRCYRELYTKDTRISDAADMFNAANTGERLEQVFAPPDLWDRQQETLKSFVEIFAEHGIYLTRANNRRVPGWLAVKELLKPVRTMDEVTGEPRMTAGLTIDDGAASHLWRCLTGAKHSERNYNDISDDNAAEHEITHLLDALRYYAAARISPSGEPQAADEEEEGEGDFSRFLGYGA